MQTVHTLDVLRKQIANLRDAGKGRPATIALVPTMGALHEGHLTLVRRAREHCDHVVTSIFVNPTQFGPNEDLDAYPRDLESDAALLERDGCTVLWAPPVGEMYPQGPANFVTNLTIKGISEGLCGAARPGHFDGVLTVVCKLFNQVRPDMAFFGEKDWQQLALIRTMARDLDLVQPPAEAVIGVATVRESDGLAMSSRNRYLSCEDRTKAGNLPRLMKQAIAAIEVGGNVADTLGTLETELLAAGFASVDYAVLADAATLAPLARLNGQAARLLVAARIGSARLIDNMAVAT